MYQNCSDFLRNCCVCLGKVNVTQVSDTDRVDAKPWISKLKYCVEKIGWSEDYSICQTCSKELDTVYKFHQLCLKSHKTRLKAMSFITVGDRNNENKSNDLETNKVPAKENINLHKEDNLSCIECSIKFSDRSQFNLHSLSAHVVEDIDKANNTFTDECDIVKNQDASKFKKTLIGKICYNTKQVFLCSLCNTTFNKCAKLILHSVSEHGIEKNEVRPYSCTKCPKSYLNSTHLKEHYLKSHQNFRNEMCVYCSKTFCTRRALNIHEKIHENKRAYQCPYCPKKFNTVNSRLSHKVTVHADPSKWKYKCDICGKKFYSKSNMDTHLRRHNQDKPFCCHLCDKRFCDSTDLRLHIPSHTNVKEFKCDKCNREYKRKRDLKMHMAKDHKVDNGVKVYVKKRKYTCNVCPKAFSSKEKLTRHLCSHTGDKPFPCAICDKRFTDKWYATQHMKTAHNMIP